MTTRNRYTFRLGVVLLVLAPVAASLINLGSAATAKTEATQTYATLQDLGHKTDQCVTSTASTDSAPCQQAVQKAKEVQQPATSVTVNVPRRSDAEVMNLLKKVIESNPGLLPKGPKGDPYTLTDEDMNRIVAAVQGRIPVPQNGRDGADAVVDYDKIVKAVVALIPVPKDGKDGATPPCMATPAQCQGADGKNGTDGAKGADGAQGRGVDPSRPAVFVRLDDGSCVFRTFYTLPPDSVDTPAGTFACGA